MQGGRRSRAFWPLAAFFALFVAFLYGPTVTIVILSFQGPEGGLTFPMRGVSTRWFENLFETQMVGDFGGSFTRSMILGAIVTVVTVVVSFMAGLAFRRRFPGATALFYLAVASLIVPSVLISLGIGLMFRLIGEDAAWWSSGLGAHLTWTLPFGLLIMFAVFNRFDRRYEEAARDLGATPWRTFTRITFPLIVPGIVAGFLMSFTLSIDDFVITFFVAGVGVTTLPLQIYSMIKVAVTPEVNAVSTLLMAMTLTLIAVAARFAPDTLRRSP